MIEEELMPLSQSLITPHLKLAFDILNPNHRPRQHQPPLAQPIQAESAADSGDLVSGTCGDELTQTHKHPRLMLTPQLHYEEENPRVIRRWQQRCLCCQDDPVTEHLFASSPVPSHFLHPVLGKHNHHRQQQVCDSSGTAQPPSSTADGGGRGHRASTFGDSVSQANGAIWVIIKWPI
ncbi:hypothetical protein V6N13_147391 [Hibiscus sabdariffa]